MESGKKKEDWKRKNCWLGFWELKVGMNFQEFMKRNLLLVLLILGVVGIGFGQQQSIGLRLGEPTGIVYKNYLNYRGAKGTAWELGFGTASNSWNHGYYENSFSDRSAYDGYHYT